MACERHIFRALRFKDAVDDEALIADAERAQFVAKCAPLRAARRVADG